MSVDHDSARRILVAVVAAMRRAMGATDGDPAPPDFWQRVATVMAYHCPDENWDRGTARDRHRRFARGMTREALEAISAGVDPETYRDTIQHVLAHGRAPEGAPPAIPGVNAEKPKDQGQAKEQPEAPDVAAEVALQKVQLRAKFYKRGYDQLLEERASTEMVLDAIQDAVAALPAVGPADIPAPTILLWNRPRRLMPLMSDLHVGEYVDPGRIKGINEYSFAVLDERMDRWCTAVEEHFQHERAAGPVELIHIPMLGDMVTGENIYRGQWLHIEASAMHQIFIGADKLAQALLRLAKLGAPILVDGIGGNHARMGRKGESDFSNDFLMYKFLEARLANQPNMRFNFDYAFWATSQHWDWRFYFCHGDNIRGWGGYPWYGQARADANTTQLMLTRGLWYHYFIHGHFHTDMAIQTPIGKRMANGNWIGTTEYGVNGGFTGRPSQKLLVLTEKGGIETEMTIYLDEITADFMNQTVAGHGLGMSVRPW